MEYPGTLYSGESDISRYDWWFESQAAGTVNKNDREGNFDNSPDYGLLLFPPKLDETGAGYVITAAVKLYKSQVSFINTIIC